jgi:acylphosphatase
VQGVWFRDSTRREAERLDLRGYARNLPSSDVEVLASGTEASVNELALWLREGPPLAQVSEVLEDIGREQADMPQVPAGFEVR